MPDLAPLTALPAPPELSRLQIQLAQSAVISELGIPGGLRMDAPIDSPVTQYMHDCRQVLAEYPPTLDTQLAAQYLSDATYVVPAAETVTDVEPLPEPPGLYQLNPSEAPNTVTDVGVQFIGGPFDDMCQIVVDEVPVTTQYINGSTLAAKLRPAVADAESQQTCLVRRGDEETSGLLFTFTHEEVQTRESVVEERQRREAGEVRYAKSGPVEQG